jgi:hypothetical protein
MIAYNGRNGQQQTCLQTVSQAANATKMQMPEAQTNIGIVRIDNTCVFLSQSQMKQMPALYVTVDVFQTYPDRFGFQS